MILPLTKNIYAYAQHILSNPTDAADITQEVMIKLWNTRRELKGVQNPRAWALKVTRNLCLDWIKKQKPVYGGEELAQNEDYTSNPLQEIETKDTVSLLRQIIDTLPENQREVLILREIEELEFEEIEQITGLTANHIRVLLSRGRSKVKEMMRNRDPMEIPEGLNEKLQRNIRQKRQRKIRQLWITAGSIAAMAVLILSFRETFTTTPRPGIQLSDNLKKERFENALRVLGNALEDEKTPVQRVLYEDHNLIIAIE